MVPIRETKEHRLAHWIAEHLWKADCIQSPRAQEVLTERIYAVLATESQMAMKIDAEAKTLLTKYEKEMDHLDSRKMFMMIKKKLIQDRNLVLQNDPALSPDDKINHLAHRVQAGILKDTELSVKVDAMFLLQAIKKSIALQISREEEVQALVRDRLATKSGIIEGSEEWDLLYKKAYTEIAQKRGV